MSIDLDPFFGTHADYDTKDNFYRLQKVISEIYRHGNMRTSEYERLIKTRNGKSYLYIINKFHDTISIQEIIRILSKDFSDTDVHITTGSTHGSYALHLSIPSYLLEDPPRPRKPPGMDKSYVDDDDDKSPVIARICMTLKKSAMMTKLHEISPKIKRNVEEVFIRFAKRNPSMMVNADYAFIEKMETAVRLKIVLRPLPVDVRLIDNVARKFGNKIENITFDMSGGYFFFDFKIPQETHNGTRNHRPERETLNRVIGKDGYSCIFPRGRPVRRKRVRKYKKSMYKKRRKLR